MVDPVALGATLAVPVLEVGAEKSLAFFKREQQQRAYDESLERTATVFNEKMAAALENLASSTGDDQLREIADSWEAVASELDDVTITYDSDEDAVDRICTAVETAISRELPSDTPPPEELRDAIETAYRNALDRFAKDIQGTDLEQRLNHEFKTDVTSKINELKETLEFIGQLVGRYEDFHELHPDREPNWPQTAKEVLSDGPYYQEYTIPPDLDRTVDHQNVLIVGRAGTGKTRALVETVDRLAGTIDPGRVIIPHESFRTVADIEPLRKRSYEGDVLLLWDDIWKFVDAEDGVPAAITKLRQKVNDDGHQLWVRATVRREEFDAVFAPEDQPDRLSSDFWQRFETAEIDTPSYYSEDRLSSIIEETLARYDIEVEANVRTELVEHVAAVDPSPAYIDALCRMVQEENDRVLTVSYLVEIPDQTLGVWEGLCERLGHTNQSRYKTLRAIWILDNLDVPLHTEPIKYLYDEALAGEDPFDLALEYLESRGWLAVDEESTPPVVQIHDLRLEAIGNTVEPITSDVHAISEALRDQRLEFALSGSEEASDLAAVLNSHFADFLIDEHTGKDRFRQLAEQHYQQSVQQSHQSGAVYQRYARYLVLRTDFQRAVDHYEEGLTIEPENESLRTAFARLLDDLGEADRALDVYLDGLHRNPSGQFGDQVAERLMSEDELEVFVEKFPTLLKHQYTPLIETHLEFLASHGTLDRAMENLQTAIKRDAEFFGYPRQVADFLNEQDGLERAIEHYELIIEQDPQELFVYYQFAELLVEHGERERAISEFQTGFARLRDKSRHDIKRFAHFLIDQGRETRAIEQYESAIEESPDDAGLRKDFATVLADLGNLSRAIDHFEAAISHAPDEGSLRTAFITTLADEGAGERALNEFERAIADGYLTGPNSFFVEKMLERGGAEIGEEFYETALSHLPTNTEIRAGYAEYLIEQGADDRAMEQFETALEHELGAKRARDVAGTLAEHLSADRAISVYETLLDYASDYAGIYSDFAELLEEVGELDRAIEQYETGIEHNPEATSLRMSFVELLVEQGNINRAVEQCVSGIESEQGEAYHRKLHRTYVELLAARGDLEQALERATDELESAVERYRPTETKRGEPLEEESDFSKGRLLTWRHAWTTEFLAQHDAIERVVEPFEAILEDYPGDLELRYEFIEFLIENQELDRAIDHSQEILQYYPGHRDLQASLSILLAINGRPEEAINQLETAIDEWDVEPRARSNLAITLVAQGELQRGTAQFHTAAERGHTTLEDRTEFAMELADQDELEHALQEIETALERGGGPSTRTVYALLLGRDGQIERAIEQLEEAEAAIDAESSPPEVHLAFAEILIEQDEHERAIEQFETGLEHHPEATEQRKEFADVLKQQGLLDRARRQYEAVVERDPADLEAWMKVTELLFEQDEITAAIEQCQRGLEYNPTWTELHTRQALLLDEAGKPEEAIAQFESGIKEMPQNPLLYRRYGEFLARKGRIDQATTQLETALEYGLNPDIEQSCPIEGCDTALSIPSLPEHLETEHTN